MSRLLFPVLKVTAPIFLPVNKLIDMLELGQIGMVTASVNCCLRPPNVSLKVSTQSPFTLVSALSCPVMPRNSKFLFVNLPPYS